MKTHTKKTSSYVFVIIINFNLKCFRVHLKFILSVFFKKKNPTVPQIEITWKLKRTCNSKCLGSHAKSSVLFFCLFEDTKKNRRTCKQMNHLLLLHATLQDSYQPSTVNS